MAAWALLRAARVGAAGLLTARSAGAHATIGATVDAALRAAASGAGATLASVTFTARAAAAATGAGLGRRRGEHGYGENGRRHGRQPHDHGQHDGYSIWVL